MSPYPRPPLPDLSETPLRLAQLSRMGLLEIQSHRLSSLERVTPISCLLIRSVDSPSYVLVGPLAYLSESRDWYLCCSRDLLNWGKRYHLTRLGLTLAKVPNSVSTSSGAMVISLENLPPSVLTQ